MRSVEGWLLLSAALLSCTIPSAYDQTYERETNRLEGEYREQERADHEAARRYAAVVYFRVGSDVIDEEGLKELSWFVEQIRPYPKAIIEVRGFADATGGDTVNQRISDQRADNVKRQLIVMGRAESQVVTSGFASEIPAATNETPKGRKSNRRVEVTVR